MAAGSLLALLAACELGTITLPARPSTVVIHGVLTPATPTQTLLVERTLTGEAAPLSLFRIFEFSAAEPIVSDGGIPEGRARVELTLPSGQTIVASEAAAISSFGIGNGVYRFTLPGASLVPGGRYSLTVTTTRGEVLTASTVFPATTPVTVAPATTFNRATDTVALRWAAVSRARGYQVRVEGPHGPWIAFTDRTTLALTGALRSTGADDLPRVFVPGFRQTVTVSAVDDNLYEYYRSENDAFTGTGLVTRVTGGLGVFGALVPVWRGTFNVTAPFERPVEGAYRLLPWTDGTLYGGEGGATALSLYVESPAARADQLHALSGGYSRPPATFNNGIVGTLSGTRVRLAFLRGQLLSDTADVWTGELRGDTLAGRFRFGATGTYVRVR